MKLFYKQNMFSLLKYYNHRKILNNLALLIGVGIPGVSRIVILTAVTNLYSIDLVGVLVYKWSIVSIISMLTVDGFGALINSRLPKVEDDLNRSIIISKQISNGLTLLFFLSFLWLFVDSEITFLDLTFPVSWLIYGICRRVLITNRQYVSLLIVEILSILFTTLLLLVFKDSITSENISVIFIPIGSFSLCLLLIKYGQGILMLIRPSLELIGLKFGFANLLSGGVGLSLIPIVREAYGNEWVAFIGLVLSVMNIIYLMPRTLAEYYTPRMAELTGSARLLEYKRFRKVLHTCLFLSLFACPLIWMLSKDVYFNVSNGLDYKIIYITIYLATTIGQLSLVPSMYFVVSEKPKPTLKSTYIHVFIISLASGVILLCDKLGAFEGLFILYFSTLISNLLRFIYMSYSVGLNENYQKYSLK